MMPINYDTLHKLYSSLPTARQLFDTIIELGVEEGRTTVDELILGSAATRRQAITLLRDLDEAGCGEFKVGRKGHPSRLVWNGDPSEIAQRVISGELVGATPDHEAAEQPPESEPDAQDLLEASSVGATAAQATLDLAEAPDEERAVAQAPKTTRAPSSAKGERTRADQIEHNYVLRPNRRVSVTLPANLSRREAEVLADWVRNLSFERS